MLIIIIMDSLIGTSTRRSIQVVSKVDVQLLATANIPSCRIRPLNARNSPRQSITLKRKRAIAILRLAPRHTQTHVVDVSRLIHNSIQQHLRLHAGSGYQLDELPVNDLELACGCVIAKDGRTGSVERLGLQVLVEVGRSDGTDPVVA
jgi:hypothetical protein